MSRFINSHNKIKKVKKLLFFVILFFLFSIHTTTLIAKDNSQVYFVIPPAGASLQSNFTVSILLDTTKPINALEMEISYPQDKLQFIGSLNARSVVDIWQGKPKLLQNGDVYLIGGLSKPFSGERGLVINLIFKPISVGEAKLSFVKSDVYIADGKGTKLTLDREDTNFSITKGSTTAVSVDEVPAIINLNDTIDDSPPLIYLEETVSPVDSAKLIVFNASDPESGISSTQMRVKRWWTYNSWTEVQNPVLYPSGVWSLELKAVNNSGLETIERLEWRGVIVKKIILLLAVLFLLVFVVFKMYNKKKRNL